MTSNDSESSGLHDAERFPGELHRVVAGAVAEHVVGVGHTVLEHHEVRLLRAGRQELPVQLLFRGSSEAKRVVWGRGAKKSGYMNSKLYLKESVGRKVLF